MTCSRSSTDTLSEPSDSEQLSGVDCDLFELYQSFEYEDDASTALSETWESQPHGGTSGHTVSHEAPLYPDNVFSESVKPAPAGIEFLELADILMCENDWFIPNNCEEAVILFLNLVNEIH